MMRPLRLRLVFLALVVAAPFGSSALAQEVARQFKYRSIAIQGHMSERALEGSPFLGPEMLREVARLGYNDICFHVEWGEQTQKITEIHDYLAEQGLIELVDELGLTTSVWVREFVDYDESWGEPTVGNEKLWKILRQRYESYLDLWPEIDYFVITNTETQMSPRGRETFQKIFELIGGVARERGAGIIVRSFFHGPRRVWLEDMLPVIPDYAMVQHKYVQGDWSLRRPNNPLIALPDDHRVVVEFDVGGEYYETDHILNCFADDLAERMEYIIGSGAEGISVRINRFSGNAFDHPNAVNYWYLGLLTSGQVENVDEAWEKFTTEYFGKNVADEMIKILRPTGEVTAEAMSLGRNAYGNARNSEIAVTRYERQGKRFEHPQFLEAYSSFAKGTERRAEYEDRLEAQLRGKPELISGEREAYEKQLASIDRSIQRLEALRNRLDGRTYSYMHWLLEETRCNLRVMEEAQLAHLKVFRIRHGADEQETARLKKEIQEHLGIIEELALRDGVGNGEEIEGRWRSRQYHERRGSYAEAGKFVTEFRLWMHRLGLGEPLRYEKDNDGRMEVVGTLDEFIEYHIDRGWTERAAERWAYWICKESDSFDEWVEKKFGGIER